MKCTKFNNKEAEQSIINQWYTEFLRVFSFLFLYFPVACRLQLCRRSLACYLLLVTCYPTAHSLTASQAHSPTVSETKAICSEISLLSLVSSRLPNLTNMACYFLPALVIFCNPCPRSYLFTSVRASAVQCQPNDHLCVGYRSFPLASC